MMLSEIEINLCLSSSYLRFCQIPLKEVRIDLTLPQVKVAQLRSSLSERKLMKEKTHPENDRDTRRGLGRA